jgi:hypothetical protein
MSLSYSCCTYHVNSPLLFVGSRHPGASSPVAKPTRTYPSFHARCLILALRSPHGQRSCASYARPSPLRIPSRWYCHLGPLRATMGQAPPYAHFGFLRVFSFLSAIGVPLRLLRCGFLLLFRGVLGLGVDSPAALRGPLVGEVQAGGLAEALDPRPMHHSSHAPPIPAVHPVGGIAA